eukprot:TRINITY_DN32225_c0_g1_i2.p1 TRINITY_DN32225_c0_g1~~TRINITY_DN32225_c0_g1_i2.p1  ORF type:complete len:291 (+),score=37.41 TRINITY_DN32225_c0_g1_i2:65-937(+)
MDADFLKRYVIENVGGFISGSVSIFAGHPFDTIKVRLQAGHSQYKGGLDCVSQLVKKEGVRALWKGMMSPLVTNSALNAITFSTWQEAQRWLSFEEGPKAPLEKVFLAGGFAGVVQCSLATPMELVRSKLQVQYEGKRVYSGNIDCIRSLYRSEGLAGLYRGNLSMMLREGPAFGIYFTTYEATKRACCPELKEGESEPMWVQAVGGATTGAVTWAAVMPIDVISTRIQCLPEHEAADASKRSVINVAKQLWQEGGIRAFYRGLTTAVVRGVVLNSIVFPVYETTVSTLS